MIVEYIRYKIDPSRKREFDEVGFALLFPFAGDVDDESIPDPGTERPERCSFGS